MTYIKNSRRDFIKGITATSLLSATTIPVIATSFQETEPVNAVSDKSGELLTSMGNKRPVLFDGPQSPLFDVIPFEGNTAFPSLGRSLSERMSDAAEQAPVGQGTAWGIPFHIPEKPIVIKDKVFSLQITPVQANWLVFLHTSDSISLKNEEDDLYKKPFKGAGQLNEEVADYIIIYTDGTEVRAIIKERHHIGMFRQGWGENSIQSVAHHKPMPLRAHHEQMTGGWGGSQTRVSASDRGKWINWIWAWENPYPMKQIAGFRFEPKNITSIVISAISSGRVSSNPLRWQARQKAILTIPDQVKFDPTLSEDGLLSQLQLDLGQVISASPRTMYSKKEWSNSYNNKLPEISEQEVIIEYTAHPEAAFHLENGALIPVSETANIPGKNQIKNVEPATQNVKVRILEKGSRNPVAVKLHVHGESGEYLAPVDRHRIPNDAWFEDYSVDFVHRGSHICTYIPGETHVKLPVGQVYIEVSKGFEIKPLRKLVTISADTEQVEIEIEKVLSWREKGWVSADTHVHFLSPNSALLEGSAEGVNI
ncbi:MAG: hypothetical protein KAT15_13535, partial [Bacteroidales bacterium]|nr:hypothetical protein [Bacteroidales bacterium]